MKTTYINYNVYRIGYTLALTGSVDVLSLSVKRHGYISECYTKYTFKTLDLDVLKARHPYVDDADWEVIQEKVNQIV